MTEGISPVQALEAILDEVEDYRRTNARSFLPDALVRQAREALGLPGVASYHAKQLRALDELSGRTVSHVFDGGLIRGDVVIACSDGAFVVVEAEHDGDSAYVTTRHGYGESKLADFVYARDLLNAGLMPQGEFDAVTRKEAEKKAVTAKARLDAAQRALDEAKKEAARLGVPA